MKILYFDCTNGISGDMLLKALMEIGDCREQVETAMEGEALSGNGRHSNGHGATGHHAHTHVHRPHTHGRSYQTVRRIIQTSSFSFRAKDVALRIYGHIAEAEAKVHGATLDTVHFHEVGRDEAIRNALGVGMALEAIRPDRIYTSDIYDGKGTVVCSHGEIPVPVPAVQALMEKCSYVFKTAENVDTEMVTPSGLAGLMGIGAEWIGAVPSGHAAEYMGNPENADDSGCSDPPDSAGRVVMKVEVRGSRDTGRGGLKAWLTEKPEEGDAS